MMKKVLLVLIIGLSLFLGACDILPNEIDETYTVTWKDYNGNVLEIDENVKKGVTPTYNSVNPSRDSEEGVSYNFTGWEAEYDEDGKNITFVAKYETVENKYKVVWINEDSVIKESENVSFSDVTKYEGETPVKASDEYFSYEFESWISSYNEETKTYTFTASYKANDISYTVKWLDDNNNVIKSESNVKYSEINSLTCEAPVKASDDKNTYNFNKWEKSVDNDNCVVNFKATYTSSVRSYLVTFKNEDGSVLQESNVEYGVVPTYTGSTPAKEKTEKYNYTFKSWDKEITSVTSKVTYTAVFSENINKYKVTWLNDDNTILRVDEVEYGKMPSYDTTNLNKASSAQYDYAFDKWDNEVVVVSKDVSYKATYTSSIRSYSVTFKNEDGTVLKQVTLKYGEVPTYDKETPTKEKTIKYTYTFKSWDKEIESVKGETVYTALFDSSVNKYKITWLNDDETVLRIDEVEYDTLPSYDTSKLEKEKTDQYEYVFDKWNSEVTLVTGDTTYKAVYKEQIRSYTLTVSYSDKAIESNTYSLEYGNAINRYLYPEINNYEILAYVIDGQRCIYSELETTKITKDVSVEIVLKQAADLCDFIYVTKGNTINITSVKNKELSELAIPARVSKIDTSLFNEMKNLTSLTLPLKFINLVPSTVTTLGINEGSISNFKAFNLDNVRSLVITDCIVEEEAFKGCSQIESVHFKGSATINNRAFNDCVNLKEFVVEVQLTVSNNGTTENLCMLKENLFAGCTNLHKVSLNEQTHVSNTFCLEDSVEIVDGFYAYTGGNIKELTIRLGYLGPVYISGLTGIEKVTLIGYTNLKQQVFIRNATIKEVILPSTLTSIDYMAFDNCINLQKIVIPSGVSIIESYTFGNCISLKSVTFEGKISKIKTNAFSGCTSLTDISISMDDGIIEDNGFNNCTGLTNVLIKGNVISLSSAFRGCDNLVKLSLPNSTNYFKLSSLGCNNLKEISYGNNFEEIRIDSSLYKNGEIPSYAFYNDKLIKKVIIANDITKIGKYAFYGCENLESIIFEENSQLKEIGESSLYCKMTSITLPDSVEIIGEKAFTSMPLTNIVLPNNVKTIPDELFSYDNTSLKYNVYENGKYLGSEDNPYLLLCGLVDYFKDTFEIHPDTVIISFTTYTTHTLKKFVASDNLKVIKRVPQLSNFESVSIPNELTYFSRFNTFNDSVLNEYKNGRYMGTVENPYYILYSVIDKEVDKFEVHPDTKSIYYLAFNNCKIKELVIPDGIISELDALNYLSSIDKVTAPYIYSSNNFDKLIKELVVTKQEVVTKDDLQKSNLEKITFLNLKEIGDGAFYYLDNLVEINFGDKLERIGSGFLSSCDKITEICLPNSLKSVGSITNYHLVKITMPIVDNLTFSYAPKEVEFTSGTYLTEGIFKNCNSLEKVILPSSLKEISADAFNGCTALININLENVNNIGSNAFNGCTALTNVNLENVKTIGDRAFYNCSSLTKLYLPNVTSIGSYSFEKCTNIASIEVNDSAKEIGDRAFSNTSITSFVIPSGVSVCQGFTGCTKLTNIEIGTNVKKISADAFRNCSSLKSIYIPDSVVEIGPWAFYNSSLDSIRMSNNIEKIDNAAFLDIKLNSKILKEHIYYIGSETNPYLVAYELDKENYGYNSIIVQEGTRIIYNLNTGNYWYFDEIYFPDTVLQICDYGFFVNAKTLRLGSGIKDIGIMFMQNVTCKIVLPDNLERLGDYSLINLPTRVMNYYEGGYYVGSVSNPYMALVRVESTDIKEFTVHKDTKIIVSNAFKKCLNLVKVNLNEGLLDIQKDAFNICISLEKLVLPASIERFADGFNNIFRFKEIYFSGTMEEWNNVYDNVTSRTFVIHCSDGDIQMN